MDAPSTLLRMLECTDDIRRTISSTRALIKESRKLMAEVDRKLAYDPAAGNSTIIQYSHASKPRPAGYKSPAELRPQVELDRISELEKTDQFLRR